VNITERFRVNFLSAQARQLLPDLRLLYEQSLRHILPQALHVISGKRANSEVGELYIQLCPHPVRGCTLTNVVH